MLGHDTFLLEMGENMKKTIYIMISRSTTIASRFIHWLTKKEYTHSSLSILDDLDEMYSFCRIYPRLPLPAGFAT